MVSEKMLFLRDWGFSYSHNVESTWGFPVDLRMCLCCQILPMCNSPEEPWVFVWGFIALAPPYIILNGKSTYVMWSSLTPPSPGKTWTPNHFISLLATATASKEAVNKSTDPGTSQSQDLYRDNSDKVIEDIAAVEDLRASEQIECNREEGANGNLSPSAASPDSRKRVHLMEPPDFSQDEMVHTLATPKSSFPSLPVCGQFMAVSEMFAALKEETVLQSIPQGEKCNVYFVVRCSQSPGQKSKRVFHDDCGVWDSTKGTTVNSYVYLDDNGEPKHVYLRGNLFCKRARVRKKAIWIPLEPQPSAIRLHRYYATLKNDPGYRKRVTCVTGGNFDGLSIVEYTGENSFRPSVHGNSKTNKAYVRTNPEILAKVSEEVLHKSPRLVYEEMTKENGVFGPRGCRQIRDKKYRDAKRRRLCAKVNMNNVVTILAMLKDNPYVQVVIHRKNKQPCVILYSEHMLAEFKRTVLKSGVMGIDRTFNLGDCFITVTNYTSPLNPKDDNEPHTVLGPMCLHWDGDFETFLLFCSHLQGVLGSSVQKIEQTIGNEHEFALTKAVNCCFPYAINLLCIKTLKEAICKHFMDIVGCDSKELVAVLNNIIEDKPHVQDV